MARVSKFAKSVFHIFLLIIVSVILNQRPIRPVKRITRFVEDLRHILLWTNIPGIQHEGQKMFIKKDCHYINCYFTTNRSLLGDLRYFDAIIFNVKDVAEQSRDLPKVRSWTQKYIFAANDSADNYPVCDPVYDKFFNWTWSYRLDSSISFKYISAYNHKEQELSPHLQLHWLPLVQMKPISKVFTSVLQTKHKAAAIFLNKCKSASKREDLVKRLQDALAKYNLTVDVFGNCGPLKCGRRNKNACYYRLKTTYYFYLALEDSMALDFITNTVMNGYDHYCVPVVYGGAEYTRFLPPHSYLDATLLSETALAKTMYDIIQNKEWYYDFFRWRNHYQIRETTPMNICTLCSALNYPAWLQMNVTYTKFRKWWNPWFEQRCNIRKKYFLF